VIFLLGVIVLCGAQSSFGSMSFSGESSSGSAGSSACWLSSYGRGVGTPLSTCASNQDLNGLLCYPECEDGYTGDGPVCWQNCEDGFTDTGADCLKPPSYGRGAGYVAWEGSECSDDNSNGLGCEEQGLLWYPNCDPGFHGVGCCVCSPNCGEGMTDIGVSCQKNSYGRGAGVPMECSDGLSEDAGLCYTPCQDGDNGVGPVCWGTCPPGYSQCGALCLTDGDCAGKILDIATKVLQGVVSIAGVEDDPAGAITGAASMAEAFIYPICSPSM